MGIPKFFRYISERYPLTSQLIEENKIPEFDNLYLDFNGIIHNCSHPPSSDGDAHFRLSEEAIFTSIFAYVDHVFSKIKPKKVFFLAVDGVAPRAKMNQQRGRRFRTAKEAKELREKAEKKGEVLPEQKAFDSNCITPGTPFMTRLSTQLRYFVHKKISEDSSWRSVTVILSGHEVPGEGEHKIMEYIRLSRAQEGYNPNLRHCLYGLDADLIMLGLLSHDPHFCLLREEVKFGPQRGKSNTSLDSISFYLLHLSLMREYLNLEFLSIEPTLSFPYSLERIIDDFILLAVFVGNDFLPNLPDLHIHENGLERLFDVYKAVLPTMDGYINNGGKIEVKRLAVVLQEMAEWEKEIFEREYSDGNWMKGKQKKPEKPKEQPGQLVLTTSQRAIFDAVRAFVLDNRGVGPSQLRAARLAMPNSFSARDRKFITDLSTSLHMTASWDEYDDQDQNLVCWRFPFNATTDEDVEWEDVDDDDEDNEGDKAVDRVLKKYNKAPVLDTHDVAAFEERHNRSIQEKMDEWKRGYYQGKLEFSYDDKKSMDALAFRYVEGLQWVMHYYYSGVASWGWFYDYHYAPRISDLRNVENMEFDFHLGTPFHPYEQLMGVLPSASQDLIPLAYRDLMYDPNSPILDFYPQDFELDLNGKKQDWEAIVKIPFIDVQRLLKAMDSREHRLTDEERSRNGWGTSTIFSFNPSLSYTYPSSLPGFFPPIYRCACKAEVFDLPTLDGLHLVPGLCDGVVLGADALAGFPSIYTLPHTPTLGYHGVNVHGQESKNKSMIINIQNPYEHRKSQDLAEEMVGARTFIGWPFLQEGMVVAVSDSLFRYEKIRIITSGPEKVISNPHPPTGLGHWKSRAERIEKAYSKRFGVITGDIEILLHVRPLKGLKRTEIGAFIKDYDDPDKESDHAVQMTLTNVASEDPRYAERPAPSLSEEFPEGKRVFFLGDHAYGTAAQVSATDEKTLSVILAYLPSEKEQNEKYKEIVNSRIASRWYPSFKVSQLLNISGRALGKITSSFMVVSPDNHKTNLGLSLKFEGKGMKVIDYSRKNSNYWEFSEKAVTLIREYKAKFPELFRNLDGGGDGIALAEDIFRGSDATAQINEVKDWLKARGVRDFEPVSLFADVLTKDIVSQIEKAADEFNATPGAGIKKAIIKNIPRQAVLSPGDAVYRLQNQRFTLGDRITMVQDSGAVPLSIKGTVISLNTKSMDVVWDVAFMAGVTLGDRCSQYRGSTVEFTSCLNLSQPQFVASTNPNAPPVPSTAPSTPFAPRTGPYPSIQPRPGQAPAGGFRPAPPSSNASAVHIMANPNRARGRGGSAWQATRGASPQGANGHHPSSLNDSPGDTSSTPNSVPINGAPRGGRGAFIARGRGRGFVHGIGVDRGRGGSARGSARGRGRLSVPTATPATAAQT